ncbi:MAG: NlpC/P60 family protein [Hyphomicrobiales bacterium]
MKKSLWFHCLRYSIALAVASSTAISISPPPSGASNIATNRARAAILYRQIQFTGNRVEALGQQYDLAQITLRQDNNRIEVLKTSVVQLEQRVHEGNDQLRRDAIFAYVTNGSAANTNSLFSGHPDKVDAINVYNQIAEGNVRALLTKLTSYKIQLVRQQVLLVAQDRRAASATRRAAKALHDASLLRATLQRALNQVKGQIARFIAEQEAAVAARSAGQLKSARPSKNFPAPPPDSRANIAVRAALSLIGVPYVWGGASRRGVDCSGLVLLAYAAAGIFLPHYSGFQYADTARVPLWDIRPGDLLFYGPNGSEHEAMYIGRGQMVEASSTGTLVHISPIRLGYGFVGLGRPRA